MQSSVGQRLKAARLRKYPKASVAARALGMEPATVRAHESGQNGVNSLHLAQYAQAYGVTGDWLLLGEGEMPTVREALPDSALRPYVEAIQDGGAMPTAAQWERIVQLVMG